MTSHSVKKTNQKDWHPADIKAALEKAGWTLRALAAHHGISGSSAFSHTFLRSYPKNEQRIAQAIGVPVQEIWPSRYFADGTKKPRDRTALREKALGSQYKSTRIGYQSNGNCEPVE